MAPNVWVLRFPMSLHISQEIRQRPKASALLHLLSDGFAAVWLSAGTSQTTKYKGSGHFVSKYHQCQSQNSVFIGWGGTVLIKCLQAWGSEFKPWHPQKKKKKTSDCSRMQLWFHWRVGDRRNPRACWSTRLADSMSSRPGRGSISKCKLDSS